MPPRSSARMHSPPRVFRPRVRLPKSSLAAGIAGARADPEVIRAARVDDDELLRVLVGRGSDLSATDGHGDTGEKPKARLSMLSSEGLLKGGESQLVVLASDEVEDLEMTPLSHREEFPKLSAREIEVLRTWIDQGAAWNRTTASAAR